MTSLPSSEPERVPQRRFHLSFLTCMWGVGFLLAALAVIALAQFMRHMRVGGPLFPLILLLPLVLGLVAGGMCLFSLGRDLLKRSGWEADTPSRRRSGLMRDALQLGSPAWSMGFVLVAFGAHFVLAALVAFNVARDLPIWFRVLIALIPAVPLAMYLRSISLDTVEIEIDELAVHVRREAYGFVFCAMIGLLVCVNLLDKAGVMPDFRWGSTQLIMIMLALLIIGAAISSRRFR